MLRSRLSLSGRYGSLRSCRRQAIVLAAVASLFGLGVLAAGASATVPGHPGEPQPPTGRLLRELREWGWEDAGGAHGIHGRAALAEEYTAANAFLKNCNGDIVEFESNERTKATDCEEVAFNRCGRWRGCLASSGA